MKSRISLTSIIIGLLAGFTLAPGGASASADSSEAKQYITSVGRAYFAHKGPDYGTTGAVSFHTKNDQANTTLTATIYGCNGEAIQTESKSGDGDLSVNFDTWSDRFSYGDTIKFKLVWESPSGSTVKESSIPQDPKYKGEADKRCKFNRSDYTGLTVTKWSKKVKATTRVGRVLKVTPTKSNGDESYSWFVGEGWVGSGRKLKVSPYYAGKPITFRVTAQREDDQKSKTVKFGTARR